MTNSTICLTLVSASGMAVGTPFCSFNEAGVLDPQLRFMGALLNSAA